MARPKLPIDPKVVQNYAKLGATNVEIAGLYGCDEGTIRKGYSEYLVKGRSERNIRLRQRQYRLAMKGNPVMLIWLGKQDLGQSDKQKQDVSQTIVIRDETVDAALPDNDPIQPDPPEVESPNADDAT